MPMSEKIDRDADYIVKLMTKIDPMLHRFIEAKVLSSGPTVGVSLCMNMATSLMITGMTITELCGGDPKKFLEVFVAAVTENYDDDKTKAH